MPTVSYPSFAWHTEAPNPSVERAAFGRALTSEGVGQREKRGEPLNRR